MSELQDRFNKIMTNIKKQNPGANWANLLTGMAVLIMVAVFSYTYFTKSKVGNTVIDDSKLLEQVVNEQSTDKSNEENVINGGKAEGTSGEEETASAGNDIPVSPGEKGATLVGETTVVQKGEGLWHVAQRVCGDGEKYNILANANGFNVWEELSEGITLKVVCK